MTIALEIGALAAALAPAVRARMSPWRAAEPRSLIWLSVCQLGRVSRLIVVSSFSARSFRALRSSGPSGRRHRVLATVDAADIRGLGTAQTVVRRGAASP